MAKFAWNETNTARAIALYTAKLHGLEVGEAIPEDSKPTTANIQAAADNDFLLSIAKDEAVQAVSEKSVRGKLTREGVYVKPEHVACVAKTTKLRKEHFVRALVHTLGIDADEVDSLKNGKQCALEALTKSLGVTNIEEAAKADYSPRPEMVAMNFLNALGVDMDDLETYQLELEEAAQQNGSEE